MREISLDHYYFLLRVITRTLSCFFSDGNQIKCSMPSGPGSGPQSKKRKRSHPNFNPTTLLASALPTPHQAKHQTHEKARSSVISAQEAALNSGEPERVRRHFLEALHPDCIFQLDLSALGLRHGVHVYREIRGASGIASYFASVVGTIPDSVTLYWQEKSVKLPDGNRELSCNFHMVGRQVFEINVLDDEVSHGEQDKLAEAVAGLTSLFSAAPSSDDTVDSVFEGVVSREDELGNRVDAGAQLFKEESALPSAKRKVRSLNEMNILVAQGSVEFEQGKHLDPPVPMNWTGTVSWIVNPSKQVIRFRSVLD